MSDSYQAIYDAVRSRIGSFEGSQLADTIARQFDISHYVNQVHQEYVYAASLLQRPSAVYKPKLFKDGDAWIALYGADMQAGVVGCGSTPEEAMADFDKAWVKPAEVGVPNE